MIETSRKLLKVLLDNVFIPAMVGTEDLDEAVRLLKEGAVHYVRRRFGADIDLTAMHFGKSTRWIYRVLAGRGDEPLRKNAKREDGTAECRGTVPGYGLMVAAVEFYLARHHQALSASACARSLRKDGCDISTLELEPLLDMYCGMGYLTKKTELTGGAQEVRYQAVRMNLKELSTDKRDERIARVGTRSRVIFPIARAYVEGVPHTYFSVMRGEVLPEIYEQLADDIRSYAANAVSAAAARTVEEDPEGTLRLVDFRGLLLIGCGPWTEPLESTDENEDGVGVSN